MEINKHIIDQRITKIVADNPAWFAKIGDEKQKKSKAFVIISVSVYLGVEMEEAKNLITEGGNDAGVDAIFIGDLNDFEFPVTIFRNWLAGRVWRNMDPFLAQTRPANQLQKNWALAVQKSTFEQGLKRLHSRPYGIFRRRRRFQLQHLAAKRVANSKSPGVQVNRAIGIAAAKPVLHIAFDGAINRSQLGADLVMAAGDQPDVQQQIAFAVAANAVGQFCPVGARLRREIRAADIRFFVFFNKMRERILRFWRRILHHCEVFFFCGAFAELALQRTGGGGVFCKYHDPAYRTVEAVHQIKRLPAMDAGKGEQAIIAGFIRLHRNAGRLVERQQRIVFVKYIYHGGSSS